MSDELTARMDRMDSNLEHICRRWSPGLMLTVACLIAGAACDDPAGGLPNPDDNIASNMPAGMGGSGSGGAGAGAGGTTTRTGEGNPGIGGALDPGASGGAGGTDGPSGLADACADGDMDFDNTSDCLDGCPADSFKIAPGVCGCGIADTDIDLDGTLDCQDMCPADIGKTEPGLCGCGLSDADSDGDDTLDCNEGCPFDATRTAPGVCGCGAPDDLGLCLRHRYSFDGAGAVATDSVGTADGTIFNTTLAGDGTLVLLGGVTDQYVELPAGIISALGSSATIEVWQTWTGAGEPWQRIFDLGSSDQGAGFQGGGVTYLFVTPANTINTHLRAAYTVLGPPAERVVNAPTALAFRLPIHVAVVIDGPAQTMAFYQDGELIGTAPTLDTTLARLNDVNNWIGRSQFIADEEYQGTIDEFRIYSVARTAEQLAAEVEAGPDALPEE